VDIWRAISDQHGAKTSGHDQHGAGNDRTNSDWSETVCVGAEPSLTHRSRYRRRPLRWLRGKTRGCMVRGFGGAEGRGSGAVRCGGKVAR
jgi:hypothetical protein